jgi:membrane fusion protein, multidrug efflux system
MQSRATDPVLRLAAVLVAVLAVAPASGQSAVVVVGGPAAVGAFAAPGQVEAVRQAVLAAQADGRVTEVLVRSGERVRSGQVLLRIDSPAARAAGEAGAAQAAGAASALAAARADFERAQRLHAQQYLSDAALQRAEAHFRTAEGQARAAEAQAGAARAASGWRELRAPYAGVVTSVNAAAGDLAQAGRPLIGFYAPGALRVVADIPGDVVPSLRREAPVSMQFGPGACSGRSEAEVANWMVVPAVDAASRSVAVRVELPATFDCLPGSLVRLQLPMKGAAAGLAVPASALLRRGELDAVYVLDAQGVAHLRQLRLGERSGDSVLVLAGLEPGERVVRDAQGYQAPAAGRAP